MTLNDLVREFWWEWGLFELWVRATWYYWRGLINFVLNEVVLFTLFYVLGLKGLNIARETGLGRWMSNNNIAFSIVYFGSAIAAWIAIFASEPWRYFARLLILFTAIRVLIEMKSAYGGWVALHVRAWRNLRVIVGGAVTRLLRHLDRERTSVMYIGGGLLLVIVVILLLIWVL